MSVRRVAALVGLFLVSIGAASLAAQQRGGGWGKLSGVIQDEDGHPIAGAQVILQFPGGPSYFSESDNTGRYGKFYTEEQLRDSTPLSEATPLATVPPGRYMLHINKSGFDPYAISLEVVGDQDTSHDVILKLIPQVTIYGRVGLNLTQFDDVEQTVCDEKVIPDFNSAGYQAFSCDATTASTKWHLSATAQLRMGYRHGVQASLSYWDLGGPTTKYQGTRTENDLNFRGGGRYGLKQLQLSLSPFVNLTPNVTLSAGVLLNRWSSNFTLENRLESGGQLVNESNAMGSESGTAFGFGASVDWRPGRSPIGLHLGVQTHSISDVVTTDVTGLPMDDKGIIVEFGASYRLR